jgi:hypothetical protein
MSVTTEAGRLSTGPPPLPGDCSPSVILSPWQDQRGLPSVFLGT